MVGANQDMLEPPRHGSESTDDGAYQLTKFLARFKLETFPPSPKESISHRKYEAAAAEEEEKRERKR